METVGVTAEQTMAVWAMPVAQVWEYLPRCPRCKKWVSPRNGVCRNIKCGLAGTQVSEPIEWPPPGVKLVRSKALVTQIRAETGQVAPTRPQAIVDDKGNPLEGIPVTSGSLFDVARRETISAAPVINAQLAAQRPSRKPGVGQCVRAYGANPANRYELRYELRELDDLATSNTDAGQINPAYPPELQPRDRTRIASELQIDAIARNLVADAYLDEFKSIDRGAPVVGDDGAVEAGNGRVMALRRAAQMYPDQYEGYKRRLAEMAAERGLAPEDVRRYKQPVLVRVHAEPVDRVAFAQEANAGTVLGMSDVEHARADAQHISTRDLLNLDVADGDLDAALRRASSREFVRGFVARLPDSERAAAMTREGELTQSGCRRIKAALFARVYSDVRLGERMFESQDDDLRNVSIGLMGSLGRMAQAEELVATGQRDQFLSIAQDVAVAVGKLIALKDSRMLVEDYVAQGQLFGRELTPIQEDILVALHDRRRSGKKVRELLSAWANMVEAQPHPDQGALFGAAGGLAREDLVDRWLSQPADSDLPLPGMLLL
jgi:hypothetical protein